VNINSSPTWGEEGARCRRQWEGEGTRLHPRYIWDWRVPSPSHRFAAGPSLSPKWERGFQAASSPALPIDWSIRPARIISQNRMMPGSAARVVSR